MRSFFRVTLLLVAMGAGLFGMMAISNAKSAIHEIEAMICFVIVAVALGSGMIVCAVDEAAKRIVPDKPKEAAPPIRSVA